MKHLYFVRHGESELNASGRWGGVTDAPLTVTGHEQARQTAIKVKKQGLNFDIIISSPLQRAHHTAQHIATAANYPHENIQLHEGFKERHFGALEAQPVDTVIDQYKKDETSIDTIEGVERLVDMQWRAQEMLDYLNSLPHETILVVGHGSFGRALRRAIEKAPLNERGQNIGNAEIIKFI